ncbi:MAG: hypothetical protein FWG20_04205 [Candidatus Cloacimonetes bacterium]|nr:hypothetical protein [Candidatus Cloacimonadota bacterium]
MKIKILTIVILVFLSSCLGSDDNTQKSVIKDILHQIQSSFNQRDLSSIYRYYHRDFKHNGNTYDGIVAVWQDRYNRYSSVEIDIVDIDINVDFAIAKIKVTFGREPTYIDPEMHGDMSYFVYQFGEWKIVGNEYEY